jgi:hypothetical protein
MTPADALTIAAELVVAFLAWVAFVAIVIHLALRSTEPRATCQRAALEPQISESYTHEERQ